MVDHLLPWLEEHYFSVLLLIVLLAAAYIRFARAYRRRLFPFLVEKRVANVIHTASGSHYAVTASGTRTAVTESGSRPIAPPAKDDQPR